MDQLQARYANSSPKPVAQEQGAKPVAEEHDTDVEELGGKLQTPPGMKDYGPGDMIIRENMMKKIKAEFETMGCVMLDTPVAEYSEILQGNYGENENEIFHLAEQGGPRLSLRYDLTVPLCRWIAINRKTFTKSLRAARIGKVYRMDKPNASKGRMREFYQCDFDILRQAGTVQNPFDLVIDDAEYLVVFCSILCKLVGRDNFILKANNRKIFDCCCVIFGIPESLLKTIGSAVDKLDKRTRKEVIDEMVEKGLTTEQAEGVLYYTGITGTKQEMIQTMRDDERFMSVEGAPQVLDEMEYVFRLLDAYGWSDKIDFDMSLIRGLHYYTGMIFEGQLTDPDPRVEGIGSICGGGRYDNLINKFVKGDQYPCAGGSIGFERVFSYLKIKDGDTAAKTCTQVVVGELGGRGSDSDLLPDRIALLQLLREAGVPTENYPKNGPKFGEQIEYTESWKIPFFAFVGETEIANNTVQVIRKVYPGDEVQLKNGRSGTIVSIEGKFYNIRNQKGKVEKMKKTNAKYIVTKSGELCLTTQQEIRRDDLVDFVKQNL